jgi:hypothetical protein
MSFAWHEIRDHLMKSSSTLGFQRSFDAIRRTGDGTPLYAIYAAVTAIEASGGELASGPTSR